MHVYIEVIDQHSTYGLKSLLFEKFAKNHFGRGAKPIFLTFDRNMIESLDGMQKNRNWHIYI